MKKFKRCHCPDIPDNTIHKLAAVIVKDKKTVVVKKVDEEKYISLGGKHEGDESFIEGLNREAYEELGIHLSRHQFLDRYSDLTPKGIPIILDAYLAETSDNPKPNQEIEGYLWVDKNYTVPLASIIEMHIIPELIKRGLM